MQTTAGASLSATTGMVRTRRRTAALLTIAAVILTLDQLTKAWAVAVLDGGRAIDVVGDVLRFRLVRNPGAAFSMFTDMTVVLTVIAAAVVVAILWVSRRVTSVAWAVALGGLLGGALGTLTDRIFREPGPMQGHVVDFIELPNWPVFNISDSSIVGSAALIAVLSFRGVAYSTLGGGHDGVDGSAADPEPPTGERSTSADDARRARADDAPPQQDDDMPDRPRRQGDTDPGSGTGAG